ncbi:IS110 family transposase [Micromonospora sp. CNB394]|uniref:IS110 family transposase n=1 Tax=Micromonospora sp. CNB394 TaxID=1169151 RepID=UPI00037AF260|nr:IS110 family transposase [Micromonospora sp. CNB394]
MASFAGGAAQAGYVDRIRDLAPQRCLVVPVDVGKRTAMALVADHYGQIIDAPFEFDLTVSGAGQLVATITATRQRVGAESVRVGVEAAGHYHQALAATLRSSGFDVVELNPYQVKMARAQLGAARVKTDVRDCTAMVELLVRGQGWPLHRQDGAMAEQLVWVAHRRRKLAAAQALGSQVHALADLAFPGLTGCFTTGLEAKTLRMLLATLPDPARVAAMSAEDLVHHARSHQVRMTRPKAAQVIAAAGEAMCVPDAQRAAAAQLLTAEVKVFDALQRDLATCDQRLAQLLPDTPAGVLTSIPGVGTLTASYYGAALGDPARFANAGAAYRYSGLAPASYESAGRRAAKVKISKVGSVELRQAMIALGTGIALHHPDFAAYKRRQLEAGKKPMVAAIAVAHRAHRLAFAVIRSQQPYDPAKWAISTSHRQRRDRSVMAADPATGAT